MKIISISALAGCLLLGACAQNPTSSSEKSAPMASAAATKDFVCEPAPAPVADIRANSYYSDAAGSIIDPVLHAKYKANIDPIVNYYRDTVKMADAYVESGDAKIGKCVVTWLTAWAKGGGLQGEVINERGFQANYIQKWALGSLGMAAFKVRDQITAADHAAIDPWMKGIATQTIDFWKNPARKRNNHYYWTTLAVASTAAVTKDDALWKKASEMYGESLSHIPNTGILDMEMARAQLALHYHNYSLLPLASIATLARWKGEDWFNRDGGKVMRLGELIADGILDPSWFETQTGKKQKVPGEGNLGWSVLMQHLPMRNKDKVAILVAKGEHYSTTAGGDPEMTLRSIARKP